MKMQEELKALSDRSNARLELLEEQYVQALNDRQQRHGGYHTGPTLGRCRLRSGTGGLSVDRQETLMTDQEYTLALMFAFTFSATCMWLMLKDL
jgi:hypothetical protein